MEEHLTDWEPDKVRQVMISQADEFFTNQIKNIKPSEDAKNWHRNVKNFSHYSVKSTLLNLKRGPVANITQWKEAEQNMRAWEDVELCQEEIEIAKMNI